MNTFDMFHGTTAAPLIANSINGVDIYWGNGKDHGSGSYFAFDFSYSYEYSKKKEGIVKQMVVCEVLPGKTTGDSN